MFKIFKVHKTARFSQCDARALMFPHAQVEMIHETVEDWLSNALGFSYEKMHLHAEKSFPVVQVKYALMTPIRLGLEVEAELLVSHLGRSSMTVEIELRNNEVLYSKATESMVQVDLKTLRPVALDSQLRSKAALYLKEPLR